MNFRKIRKLNLIKRNSAWWKSDISTRRKLAHYIALTETVVRMRNKNKKINYLGSSFYYDNPTTPLSIMYYPHEITRKILKNVDSEIKSVLDIGGNIGQFSVTLSTLCGKKVNIDIIEPNPEIYRLLIKNTQEHKNIKIFNYALGNEKLKELYFEPNRSSVASFVHENSGEASKVKKVAVKTKNNVKKITNNSRYDLVKIDVEGYEFDLLKNISKIDSKYFFIELSGQGRKKNYSHLDLFSLIREKFGNYDIVHVSSAGKTSEQFDVLLEKR